MGHAVAVLALLTGFCAGGLFTALELPLPAPPTLPGVLGIVGIWLGYVVVQRLGVGYDLLGALGL
ncbi:MAG: XapX domain-containing protein [Halolamina sp.]